MALNDISLTAGMRSNLISLQGTTKLMDRTQERLSSGKKVNSALDNPTNFFAAQSHTQRAADLSVRKDGMTEAIQGVQAANKGITGITSLIEAAKGLTQAARSADTNNRNSLADQFNTVLTQITQLAGDSGYKGKNFLTGDNLNVLFNEGGGSSLTIAGFDATSSGLSITTVSIGTAQTTATVNGTTNIQGSVVVNVAVHTGVLSTALPAGYVATSTFFVGMTGTTVTNGAALSGQAFTIDISGLTAGGSGLAITGNVTINAVYVDGVDASGLLTNITMSGSSSGSMVIHFSSGAQGVATATGVTISFDITVAKHMDTGSTNVPTTLNVFNLKNTDTASGLQILTSGVEVFVDGNFVSTGNFTLSTGKITFVTGVVPPSGTVTYKYNSGFTAGDTTAATTYQTTYTGQTLQANQAITAVYVSGVQATNVSISGSEITFNGNLPTTGQAISYKVTTTTAATTGGWDSDAGIDSSVNQLDAALGTLRTQSASLASNLSVVTIRQDFTDGMVNTLLKGADNLTLADMNEEGANMLMLQTRQQLGTTSLSMASQAAQSVLRLF